jgi:hypothetical protein
LAEDGAIVVGRAEPKKLSSVKASPSPPVDRRKVIESLTDWEEALRDIVSLREPIYEEEVVSLLMDDELSDWRIPDDMDEEEVRDQVQEAAGRLEDMTGGIQRDGEYRLVMQPP